MPPENGQMASRFSVIVLYSTLRRCTSKPSPILGTIEVPRLTSVGHTSIFMCACAYNRICGPTACNALAFAVDSLVWWPVTFTFTVRAIGSRSLWMTLYADWFKLSQSAHSFVQGHTLYRGALWAVALACVRGWRALTSFAGSYEDCLIKFVLWSTSRKFRRWSVCYSFVHELPICNVLSSLAWVVSFTLFLERFRCSDGYWVMRFVIVFVTHPYSQSHLFFDSEYLVL